MPTWSSESRLLSNCTHSMWNNPGQDSDTSPFSSEVPGGKFWHLVLCRWPKGHWLHAGQSRQNHHTWFLNAHAFHISLVTGIRFLLDFLFHTQKEKETNKRRHAWLHSNSIWKTKICAESVRQKAFIRIITMTPSQEFRKTGFLYLVLIVKPIHGSFRPL